MAAAAVATCTCSCSYGCINLTSQMCMPTVHCAGDGLRLQLAATKSGFTKSGCACAHSSTESMYQLKAMQEMGLNSSAVDVWLSSGMEPGAAYVLPHKQPKKDDGAGMPASAPTVRKLLSLPAAARYYCVARCYIRSMHMQLCDQGQSNVSP